MKLEHPLAKYRHPDVFEPGQPLPEPGKKEPFFGTGWPSALAYLTGLTITMTAIHYFR